MKLSEIKPNPANPRIIKDDKFKKLVQSISEFPKAMSLRPIITDNSGMILGGNQRFKALQQLCYKEVPDAWVKRADELTEDEKRRFILMDNISFGEMDWEAINQDWSDLPLEEWGLDLPSFDIEPTGEDLIGMNKDKPATMKITFPTPDDLQNCESEIQEVINRICPKAFYSVSAGEI